MWNLMTFVKFHSTRPMSSSSNGTSSTCKSKVEGEVVGQNPLGVSPNRPKWKLLCKVVSEYDTFFLSICLCLLLCSTVLL